MSGFATYLKNATLNHTFGKSSYTPPTIYVALSFADPTVDGSGLLEPTAGAYARKLTAASDWGTASGGSITNSSSITFATVTANWTNGANTQLTHFALYDAVTGGNLLAFGTLNTPRTITTGQVPTFTASSLTTTMP